jgi:hypothetical protein
MESRGLVTVSVSVPQERIGELYRYVADLNEGGSPPTGPQPWDPGDTEVAQRLYRMVSDNARRILDQLMELGDGGSIGGGELAQKAGIPKGAYGVAGSLSSVGKAASKLGRELPYRTAANAVGGPGIYGMQGSVSELFRAARDASGGWS